MPHDAGGSVGHMPRGLVPLEAATHTPGVAPVQVQQAPVHSLEQQTSSTHQLLKQSEPLLHDVPFAPFPVGRPPTPPLPPAPMPATPVPATPVPPTPVPATPVPATPVSPPSPPSPVPPELATPPVPWGPPPVLPALPLPAPPSARPPVPMDPPTPASRGLIALSPPQPAATTRASDASASRPPVKVDRCRPGGRVKLRRKRDRHIIDEQIRTFDRGTRSGLLLYVHGRRRQLASRRRVRGREGDRAGQRGPGTSGDPGDGGDRRRELRRSVQALIGRLQGQVVRHRAGVPDVERYAVLGCSERQAPARTAGRAGPAGVHQAARATQELEGADG